MTENTEIQLSNRADKCVRDTMIGSRLAISRIAVLESIQFYKADSTGGFIRSIDNTSKITGCIEFMRQSLCESDIMVRVVAENQPEAFQYGLS